VSFATMTPASTLLCYW